MLKLEQGRPADTAGRLEKEIRVYDFLDKLGVIYDRVDHEALMTMEACEEADRVLEATICKNLFLCTANKKEFYLLMIVGDKRLVTKDVSKKLGTSRLSFANESYMEEYLDITQGSVSVMGLMNDVENHVQLVIDEDVLKGEYVGCHPCINTSSLRVRTADLMEKNHSCNASRGEDHSDLAGFFLRWRSSRKKAESMEEQVSSRTPLVIST